MMLIGIDLGTNNTVLSYYKNGHLHLINKAIPSIVYVEDNIIKIGEDALLLNHHKNLKRKLTNNPKILYLYQAYLTKIKEIIDNFLNQEEYQVIVTVPAYFSEIDKDITKKAILSSGLPLLRLLAEPTAAAITYGYFHHTTEEVILVFDMGAGTTDLTLLRKSLDNVNENFYEVMSIMGDVKFGGEDITNVLSIEYHIEDAENKKILLSDNDIKELSQKKYFEMLDIKYTEKINFLLDKILFDGDINKKDVNQIILVGGSTKNPFIRKTIENYFQKDLKFLIDPDTAVSFGACIYGNSLQNKTNNVVLVDRLALSFGVEIEDGKYAKLIEKGSIIPIKKESFFTTQEDDQDYIIINIYQGEHHYIKDNYFCGSFKIQIEPRKKCVPKILVSAEINPDGILIISAKDGKNEDCLKIHTIRNNNIEKFSTILPQELYEEEFEMLYGLYSSIKQQIIFQLKENIYLKIDKNIRTQNILFIDEIDEKVERFKYNYNRLFKLSDGENNIEKMGENIIEIKDIIHILKSKFVDYLTNYELENTKTDWKKKIEMLINTLDTYNISEETEERVLKLIEQIVELDNINCDLYFTEINDLLGINF